MPKPEPSPGRHELQFYDHAEAELKPGSYRLTATHEFHCDGEQQRSFPTATVRLEVSAPRFTLDPAEVHAVYPPAHASGAFGRTLPQIVLKRATLPWERQAFASAAGEGGLRLPWVALLVLHPDELDHGETPERTRPLNVADLPDLQKGDAKSGRCSVISLRRAVFERIAPSIEELPFLAHVRRETGGGKAAEPVAVVIANRFPWPKDDKADGLRPAIVHLVSLEGVTLPRRGQPPALATGAQGEGERVTLVSLASWMFSTSKESGTAMQSLLEKAVSRGSATDLGLSEPAVGSGDLAAYMAQGYAVLPWITRSDRVHETVALYRGPLVATGSEASGHGRTPFPSASAAMIYDQTLGVFDHSLAAAWQIGQLLALADGSFARNLTALRRHQMRAAAGKTANRAEEQRESWYRRVLLSQMPASARTQEDEAYRDHLEESVVAWLERLLQLRDIPFPYLVPGPGNEGAARLPPHSVRCFHVDSRWLAALLDGALSLGGRGGGRTLVSEALVEIDKRLHHAAWAKLAASAGTKVDAETRRLTMSGFIMRSELAAAWPGLKVTAAVGTDTLHPLRSELLAPDILFCLFAGEIDRIDKTQPAATLHVEVGEDYKKAATVDGRKCEFTIDLRQDGSVVDVDAVVSSLTRGGLKASPAMLARCLATPAVRLAFGK